MPIRSPRRLYQIQAITRNVDDDPAAFDPPIDEDPNGTEVFVYAKIKESIGDYLGLTPVAWNDPVLEGTFGESQSGDNLNRGATYARNLGGFRVASYKLIAETTFSITEKFVLPGDTTITEVESQFRTMSIGLPKGHKVWQVRRWLGGLQNFDNIRAMVTPSGRQVDLYSGG